MIKTKYNTIKGAEAGIWERPPSLHQCSHQKNALFVFEQPETLTAMEATSHQCDENEDCVSQYHVVIIR